MKVTITFDAHEEREEIDAALKGMRYKTIIDTLYDEVFRPHFKYDKPLMAKDDSSAEELTEAQRLILEQVWENVSRHLNQDD